MFIPLFIPIVDQWCTNSIPILHTKLTRNASCHIESYFSNTVLVIIVYYAVCHMPFRIAMPTIPTTSHQKQHMWPHQVSAHAINIGIDQ